MIDSVTHMNVSEVENDEILRARILGIDRNDIGEILGVGQEHRVFSMRGCYANCVLKLPRVTERETPIPLRTPRELANDLSTVQAYFPRRVPRTEIRDDGETYCIIQQHLGETEYVTPALYAQCPSVHEGMDEIFDCIQKLLNDEGEYLELVGWEGYRQRRHKPHLSNVLRKLTDHSAAGLMLPDFSLKTVPAAVKCESQFISDIIFRATRDFIAKHFGRTIDLCHCKKHRDERANSSSDDEAH